MPELTISKCPICGCDREIKFRKRLLAKYEVNYLMCNSCGLLQTEEPYWLEEAYEQPIAITDTGILARNLRLSRIVSTYLYFVVGTKVTVLDAAGGYGLFTRLMRDIGFDCYWSDKYSDNIFAQGFAYCEEQSYQVATAFEVLEHVMDPAAFVAQLFRCEDCEIAVLSTELFDEIPSNDWWYFSESTGQHVSFYQLKTLQRIAEELSLSLVSKGNLHVFYKEGSRAPRRKIILGKTSYLLSPWVKLRMASKTFRDFERLNYQH